ncbi:hypothetical protein CCM_06072 [Cordyceps militaris CM01]|uniref:Uncharacterized protein n=1 Tax=Cordyceps militaris (strain CM01) TaxID=983644 RepID=G3JIL5_CORMM|nr:uncharacterized protein CCM_06072 [Cordyceps militaris CM01]EGX91912.1 hypothetical protein CCM_06072 [Cordyceps militaris CM01]
MHVDHFWRGTGKVASSPASPPQTSPMRRLGRLTSVKRFERMSGTGIICKHAQVPLGSRVAFGQPKPILWRMESTSVPCDTASWLCSGGYLQTLLGLAGLT